MENVVNFSKKNSELLQQRDGFIQMLARKNIQHEPIETNFQELFLTENEIKQNSSDKIEKQIKPTLTTEILIPDKKRTSTMVKVKSIKSPAHESLPPRGKIKINKQKLLFVEKESPPIIEINESPPIIETQDVLIETKESSLIIESNDVLVEIKEPSSIIEPNDVLVEIKEQSLIIEPNNNESKNDIVDPIPSPTGKKEKVSHTMVLNNEEYEGKLIKDMRKYFDVMIKMNIDNITQNVIQQIKMNYILQPIKKDVDDSDSLGDIIQKDVADKSALTSRPPWGKVIQQENIYNKNVSKLASIFLKSYTNKHVVKDIVVVPILIEKEIQDIPQIIVPVSVHTHNTEEEISHQEVNNHNDNISQDEQKQDVEQTDNINTEISITNQDNIKQDQKDDKQIDDIEKQDLIPQILEKEVSSQLIIVDTSKNMIEKSIVIKKTPKSKNKSKSSKAPLQKIVKTIPIKPTKQDTKLDYSKISSFVLVNNTQLVNKYRALLVGINYTKTQYPLRGCYNDVNNMKTFLSNKGYNEFLIMTDDIKNINTCVYPTKENILSALKWLITGTLKGDKLFFHFSGHGGSVPDLNGDELLNEVNEDINDKDDECIYDCNLNTIIDDDLKSNFVANIPKGVQVRCIMDCCHSGTNLDLPYIYRPGLNFVKSKKDVSISNINIISISGCRDDQTSADAYLNFTFQGALTATFLETWKNGISTPNGILDPSKLKWKDFIVALNAKIRNNRFPQVPVLSTCFSQNITKLVDI
jgi:hypothetical protein